MTDSVSNVDAGIPNFSTWEVFLEYWVPLEVSIMTVASLANHLGLHWIIIIIIIIIKTLFYEGNT